MSVAERMWADVTAHPIDHAWHVSFVSSAAAGAVVTFSGQVRNHDPGIEGVVTALEYSAHPDAADRLREIIADVLAMHDKPGEVRVAASYRVGTLYVGDLAMVVATSSAHREAATRVNGELVEAIKHGIPVWKKQFNADGDYAWSALDC